MSLRRMVITDLRVGFPRVSGDEPGFGIDEIPLT